MSNQRPGKFHAAGARDNRDTGVSVRSLLAFLKAAEKDLKESDDFAAAFRFEMLIEFIEKDYLTGNSDFTYQPKHLGI